MNERRVTVVKCAFDALAQESGALRLSDVTSHFCPQNNPLVKSGKMTEEQLVQNMLDRFEKGNPEGIVTWEQFVDYYRDLSEMLDRTQKKETDKDGLFELIVERCWGLEETHPQSPDPRLITFLETPSLLAATQPLNLMWVVDGQLVGYRAVVKPIFARGALPLWLRAHCLTVEETQAAGRFRYLPAQTALLAPYNLIWPAAGDSTYEGIPGVITSNIELHLLPVKLREAILPAASTPQGVVRFVPSEPPKRHPMYFSSSETFGTGVEKAANARAAHNWAGRKGDFTQCFTTGSFRSSGLNTSLKRMSKQS